MNRPCCSPRTTFYLISFLLVLSFVSPASSTASETGATTRRPPEQALAQELGADFYVAETDHFRVIHDGAESWVHQLTRVLEYTRGQFFSTLQEAGFTLRAKHPPLTWVAFSSMAELADYALRTEHADLSHLEAYYSGRSNRVALVAKPVGGSSAKAASARIEAFLAALSPSAPVEDSEPGIIGDLERLSHEAAHQLSFNSGLLERGVMYPLWVSEGLATSFEIDASGVSGLRRPDWSHRQQLLDLVQRDDLAPFEQLLVLTQCPRGDLELSRSLYVQAWGLFRFLYETRRSELKDYLEQLAELRPGRRSEVQMGTEIERVFGPVELLRIQWSGYLKELERTAVAHRESAASDGSPR